MNWIHDPIKAIDHSARELAVAHQNILTKPQGSLGRLEEIAISFAGWHGNKIPKLNHIGIRVFAGDHGVCDQDVSAFPQVVTAQMIENFAHGGAAISVLSQMHNADFNVVNLGTVGEVSNCQTILNYIVAPRTEDFTQAPAMTKKQLEDALSYGRLSVNKDWDVFIGGEMGIGNTTSAAAIFCALFDKSADQIVGRGTGVDNAGLQNKIRAVNEGLNRHSDRTPLLVLQCFGGFEIAALVGAYMECAQKGIPILVDGFICSAAAAVAIAINPNVKTWMMFSHQSAESAHLKILNQMNVQPLLDLEMRLGEGSGAAVALPIIQSALILHERMATFDTANVANKSD